MTRRLQIPPRLVAALPDWVIVHPRLAACGAVVAIIGSAVTGWFGGFRAVPDAPPPALTVDATITTNEWHLRPQRAWISDRDPTGRRAPAGGAILVVELMAENRTDRSSGSIVQALRLLDEQRPSRPRAGQAGPSEQADVDPTRQGRTPTLVLLRDPSFGAIVHPGLPERVAATWDLRPPQAPPTSVRLRVIGRDWVERDSLIAGSGWMRDRPVGELTLTVEDRRPPTPHPNPLPASGARESGSTPLPFEGRGRVRGHSARRGSR